MYPKKLSRSSLPVIVSAGLTSLLIHSTATAAVFLGSAANYGVLAGTTVTNTGLSVVKGEVGVQPGTSITGFPPGLIIDGALHANDGPATFAQADALAAYNNLAGMAVTQVLTGTDLGGRTLTPGVYFFATSAQLTGILTLDGLGLLDPVFVFKVGSTFTSAANSSLLLTNGTRGAKDVFFQVGSSATLGVNTAFAGTIIASSSNTLNTGATVDGRIISLNGAVTLDNNTITAVPEPSSAILWVVGVAALVARRKRG